MQTFHDQKILAFSPAQMFDVVARVEDYPQFLPLCDALHVRSRETQGDVEIIIADMSVGYGPVRETFTSQVTLDRGALKILVEYLDGPFSHLENRWLFEPVNAGGIGEQDAAGHNDVGTPSITSNVNQQARCQIDFYLAYEFRSMMLQMLMGGMFETAYRKFVAAFEARAREVYGTAVLRNTA